MASQAPAGSTVMTGYMYDAEGNRVSKGTIQQWSCNPTTAQYATQTDYIVGPGGQQMSEYAMQPNNTMAWVHTNVFVGGKLLATYAQDSTSSTPNGLLHFYLDDPLGSRRAQTDYAGNVERNCGNLPYGVAMRKPAILHRPSIYSRTTRETQNPGTTTSGLGTTPPASRPPYLAFHV